MIIPSGPRLVHLLGLSMTDEQVGQALQSLGVAVPEITPYKELDVTVESLGVDIRGTGWLTTGDAALAAMAADAARQRRPANTTPSTGLTVP
jgi:hypothetical protein